MEPEYPNTADPAAGCSNCGGVLETVGNRKFMMYKRARLPQPSAEAQVCNSCGWVENDNCFQALLAEYLKKQ